MIPRIILILVTILTVLTSCKKKETLDHEKLVQIFSHRNLGVAYLEENNLSEAQKEFQKLVTLVSAEAMPHANLGLTLLRNNDLPQAESELNQAVKMDPENPDIRLIFAEVLIAAGRPKEALDQLHQGLQQNPKHLRCNYRAAQILLRQEPSTNAPRIKQHLQAVLDAMPSSLPVRLQLCEVLLVQNDKTALLRHLEEIRRQVPGMPEQASSALQDLLNDLRKNNTSEATIKLRMLHNLLKPSSVYQQSIIELNGPGGSAIGFPILHFSSELMKQLTDSKVLLSSLHFAGSTPFGTVQSAPLAADLDSDGDPDLVIPRPFSVFRNDQGKFVEITSKTGIKMRAECWNGFAADYDNDSKIDLFFTCLGQNILLKSQGNFLFQDVSSQAGIASSKGGGSATWIDLDEDADLDLLLTHSDENHHFRNNGDGTFGSFHDSLRLPGKKSAAAHSLFADFDNDADLDVLLITDDGVQLFDDERAGNYKNVTAGSGLEKARGVVAIGDYDNDGLIDLFTGGTAQIPAQSFRKPGDEPVSPPVLFRNTNGTFAPDKRSPDLYKELARSSVTDSSFLDFDNDGHLDLALLLYEKGLRLFRNDGTGNLTAAPTSLPKSVPASGFLVDDFDGDGDLDLLTFVQNYKLELLRNQGGNTNHWIKVRLAALAMESGKNNHYGIGAQLEVRSDVLYQKQVVTQTITHFGLGPRSKADVVRVTWNNGVPQNHFLPQANQTIVEKQVLKGSCPFLYAWNGKRYEFVTDIMWRSALGMPLGFLGASSRYAFPDSTDEYLKIAGNQLQPVDNEYRIQITEELWETVYVDRTNLIAVDHPADTEIYIDEKFVTPPFPKLHVYSIRKKLPLLSAVDGTGANVLPELEREDERYVAGLHPTRYQGITELHDLILDPGQVPTQGKLLLFLKGWIFPTDASINVAISQTSGVRSIQPYLQVINKKGEWQTVFENISFPMGKNKMMILDLTGKFLSKDHRIRIRTNLQIYWDSAFFSIEEPDAPILMTNLPPSRADLHYRGFSKLYRKSDYGPHLFDYNELQVENRWRDLEGFYTRYGDVLSLLQESDDRYVILNSGDEISIAFPASATPPLKAGWKRDFLIYSDGWIKDGDLNTAYSKTVEPLPFQNMTQYPYGKEESYPRDEVHRKFLNTYNTRKVLQNQTLKTDKN